MSYNNSKLSNRDKLNISHLLKDQYSSSRAHHEPGEEDPMEIANLNYEDHSVTKKQRIDAQLASLKIKRRTKFQPIPMKRDSSKSVFKSPSKGSGRNSEMTFASPQVNTEYGQIMKTEPMNSPVPEQRGSVTVTRKDEADNLVEMTE